MAHPSPVRAALPLWGLALVLLVAVAAVFVAMRWSTATDQQAAVLGDEAALFLAGVESGAPSLGDMAERYFEGPGSDSTFAHTPSLFVVDRNGEPQLIYRPPADGVRAGAEEGIDWQMHLAAAETDPVQTVMLPDDPYVVAIHAARNGRAYLALVAPAVSNGRSSLLALAGGMVGTAWLLLGFALWVSMRAAQQRPLDQLASITRKLGAQIEADADSKALKAMEAEVKDDIGEVAEPLFLMANSVGGLRTQLDEARAHLNALFQVHTSYVLLVTLDGTIVDANPAFYAVTGLPQEAVRGCTSDVLDEIMPMEPVLKLAQRSQSEGAAFADIDYAIRSLEDATRPVKLSLLAVRSDGRPAVLVVASDKMKERTLERQIESFSDSLDLMVDKRMEELTNGQQRVDELVAATGAVLMAFDRAGGTRRWNEAAAKLTGCELAQVPHLDDVPTALGLDEEDTSVFSAWLFGNAAEACVVTVHARSSDSKLYAWHRARVDEGALEERRVLVGVALPPFEEPEEAPPPVAESEEASLPAPEPEEEVLPDEPEGAALSFDELDEVDPEPNPFELVAEAQALAQEHIAVLRAELGAPLDTLRTYTLRLHSNTDPLSREAETCLQMIDGASQMIENIMTRATVLPDDTASLPESASTLRAKPSRLAGFGDGADFLSGGDFAPLGDDPMHDESEASTFEST
ncbi:MAG: PAS domain-containing protein [Bacteroidota bacterium]